MDSIPILRDCAKSADPVEALRECIIGMRSKGVEKASILRDLEALVREFRESGNEKSEDAVTDVMDFLVGWCSPHVRID